MKRICCKSITQMTQIKNGFSQILQPNHSGSQKAKVKTKISSLKGSNKIHKKLESFIYKADHLFASSF